MSQQKSVKSVTLDCVIIGAGAAGLHCAALVGQGGASVRIIEKSKKIGAKILISGGGRCNFTNLDAAPAHFLSSNPHYMKSALSRYTPWDFVSLFSAHGLTYNEKKQGQLFCDQGAKAVVKMLHSECTKAGVTIQLETTVEDVSFDAETQLYHCRLSGDDLLITPRLVVATGGLSIPKMGATDYAYGLARQFGLQVTATRPALVPFTFAADDLEFMKPLTGVAIDATLSCAGISFRDHLLFTHRGLSGPAILQISSYWREGKTITVDLLPGNNAFEILHAHRQQNPTQQLATVLSGYLPARFAKSFVDHFHTNKPMAQFSNKQLQPVADQLSAWVVTPNGTEGYRTAEVTLGGVDPACLSSKTMAAKDHPGLYFIGECVDVTGWLGGYNFQWAWASAAAAATHIGQQLKE